MEPTSHMWSTPHLSSMSHFKLPIINSSVYFYFIPFPKFNCWSWKPSSDGPIDFSTPLIDKPYSTRPLIHRALQWKPPFSLAICLFIWQVPKKFAVQIGDSLPGLQALSDKMRPRLLVSIHMWISNIGREIPI